eukprot:1893205-Rhodomonas_salina.1
MPCTRTRTGFRPSTGHSVQDRVRVARAIAWNRGLLTQLGWSARLWPVLPPGAGCFSPWPRARGSPWPRASELRVLGLGVLVDSLCPAPSALPQPRYSLICFPGKPVTQYIRSHPLEHTKKSISSLSLSCSWPSTCQAARDRIRGALLAPSRLALSRLALSCLALSSLTLSPVHAAEPWPTRGACNRAPHVSEEVEGS